MNSLKAGGSHGVGDYVTSPQGCPPPLEESSVYTTPLRLHFCMARTASEKQSPLDVLVMASMKTPSFWAGVPNQLPNGGDNLPILFLHNMKTNRHKLK